jgi:hydrogenase expression/formation protein HypE
MVELIDRVFRPAFANPALDARNDHAVLDQPPGRLVLTTDAFVIAPLLFPGGDIGSLAVHGTVNDLAMAGARPLHLAASFILEEGLELELLEIIVRSMGAAARAAGIDVVTGDTKVVERGKGDGLFITTTGVGVVAEGIAISGDRARPGDVVLVSGTLGDHGVAIMARRAELDLETKLLSDSAALHRLVAAMLEAVPDIHVLRDPTRGGLAATLNEIAQQSGVGVWLVERAIPVRPEVRGVCELLGLDPLDVANEGKLVAICAEADAERLLAAMRAHPLGRDAAIVGRVVDDPRRLVELETRMGGRRLVDWLAGEPLPRIC